MAAALLLTAGVVNTACSSDEPVVVNPSNEGTTHMSLLIGLPKAGGDTRAAQDGQDETDPKYNHVGKWKGSDKIENIDVYVFDADADAFQSYTRFPEGQFQLLQPTHGATNESYIKPLKGIKTTAGNKKVYVVVNPTAKTLALLPQAGNVAAFEAKLKSADLGFDGQTLITDPGTAAVVTRADQVAKVDATKDVILMTGLEAGTVNVQDNVTENTTLNTATNRASVKVSRAVARVLVSKTLDEYNVSGDKPGTVDPANTPDEVIGKITDIKFVVGQGEAKMFFTQQPSDDPTLWAFKTPASGFKPTAGDYNVTAGADATAAVANYDYAGLWKGNTGTIKGIEVTTRTWHVAGNNPGTLGNITGALDAQVSGEFLLPNTHKYGVNADATDYRKGNTAYVLVRAKFTPAFITSAAGVVTAATAANFTGGTEVVGGQNLDLPNGSFVLGANGHYYKNVTDAQTHVPNMECSVYVGGKVLYFAWINPDVVAPGANGAAPRWFNSPVIRNNIYHIQITGFHKVGSNWNPLVPGDPNRPENPDPKPNNPKEPKVPNGTDPNDPLTPKETWMSVHTTILPWEVHSYEITLQ